MQDLRDSIAEFEKRKPKVTQLLDETLRDVTGLRTQQEIDKELLRVAKYFVQVGGK